jgi:hypothetical protein
MLLQHRVDDLALEADAAAVDDADFTESPLNGLIQILFHDNLDFSRLERVEVY